MPSLYTFSEYSTDWPLEFEREAGRLRRYFKDEIVAIHHIGSTSVPGLAAKPVIDVLPVIRHIEAADALTPLLEKEGYRAWGEYGLAGRRFFTRDRNGYRTHNIHIYGEGNPDIERHLAFCAYLRAHADARREYEAVKRAAYARFPVNIDGYMECKDGWIKQHEIIALDWFSRGKIPESG
ncbi:MAG: GrpB family protein [Leptolinea sp.]|nr:GrpB family protein [Leptolinea sp.]